MKAHGTLIEKLVRIYSTYGGHREDIKLRAELANLDLSVYTRENGQTILVETAELNKLTPRN